jgi:hypothetical protein
MFKHPIFAEWRRRSVRIAVTVCIVMVAVLLVAGCFRENLCGGKFVVYELAEYLTPGENIVHLTEKDFAELPELGEVMRGEKRTNATCRQYYDVYGHCIGGSYFPCKDHVILGKYLDNNENASTNLSLKKLLEYKGKYYYLEITEIS